MQMENGIEQAMGAWKNSAVATCAHVNSIYVWVKLT